MLGAIAFVLFGIVFFRLWYLQVLTGDQAARWRETTGGAGAHRGAARRHRGPQQRKLVTTKQAAVVQIVPSLLPERVRKQADEYRKQLAAAEQ